MATFPLADGQKLENAGATLGASKGTTITAAASANTKGSYTQLIASTSFRASGIIIMLSTISATVDYLIDIAIGAGGSEQIIISNLLASGSTPAMVLGGHYFFPIEIPAGSRIAARCQASTLSSTVRVSCLLVGVGFSQGEGLSQINTYGDATADSGGTSIDPGGTTNTKGSYTQITASTTRVIRYLAVAFGSQLNNARSSQSWLVDIAVGAAASEQIIVPDLVIESNTSPDIVCPQVYNLIPIHIPAGSRIAVRAASSGNDATDRLFDIVLYGAS